MHQEARYQHQVAFWLTLEPDTQPGGKKMGMRFVGLPRLGQEPVSALTLRVFWALSPRIRDFMSIFWPSSGLFIEGAPFCGFLLSKRYP